MSRLLLWLSKKSLILTISRNCFENTRIIKLTQSSSRMKFIFQLMTLDLTWLQSRSNCSLYFQVWQSFSALESSITSSDMHETQNMPQTSFISKKNSSITFIYTRIDLKFLIISSNTSIVIKKHPPRPDSIPTRNSSRIASWATRNDSTSALDRPENLTHPAQKSARIETTSDA